MSLTVVEIIHQSSLSDTVFCLGGQPMYRRYLQSIVPAKGHYLLAGSEIGGVEPYLISHSSFRICSLEQSVTTGMYTDLITVFSTVSPEQREHKTLIPTARWGT